MSDQDAFHALTVACRNAGVTLQICLEDDGLLWWVCVRHAGCSYSGHDPSLGRLAKSALRCIEEWSKNDS